MSRHHLLKILTAGMVGFLFWHEAIAASQSVTANISFDVPLTLTKTADISFGAVTVGTADTYTITPSGTVSSVGAGTYLYGTTAPGSITISGSPTQAINITAGGYVEDHGVTLQNASCSYDGGAAQSCAIVNAAASGSGKILTLGVEAVVDGTQTVGMSAAPSFTIAVFYP